MNDSLSELRKVFEDRGIKRVAMIDDVFDVPAAEGVERERYAEFVDRFQSDDPLRRAIARVGGEIRGLPDFEALGDDDLEPLWRCVYGAHLPGPKLDTQQVKTVRALFGGHDDGVLDMLDDVQGLLELFWKDLGREVAVHGARPEPGDVANADIVVVDYYLELRCTHEEAAQRTSSIVKDIASAARQGKGRVPQFLLVSSRPQAIDPGAFREHAELMNSRFRFFTKRALSTRAVEHLVNLHDLVDASDRTEKIERLVRDWGAGGRKAIESVEQHMLDLDVSDLVYLDYFRLVNEGANIGEYLRWFLTALAGSRIATSLDRPLWSDARDMRLVEPVKEDGNTSQHTLIKTFDEPSRAIAEAYGEILLDRSRAAGGRGFPAPLAADDLSEGDLFVQRSEAGTSSYDGAEVRLVMTPSCDLIRRRPGDSPAAKSVLLLPGTLVPVDEVKPPDPAEVYFVDVQGEEKQAALGVKWDFHRPLAVEWSLMAADGPGEGFERLGRVRELYFHRIREHFSGRLTRVGTRVAPPLPEPRAGDVCVAVDRDGKKEFERVMEFSAEQRYVWEICAAGKGGSSQCTYVTSRRFVRALRAQLEEMEAKQPEKTGHAAKVVDALGTLKTQMDLARPMRPGRRGEGGAVDIRRAVRRGDGGRLKSQGCGSFA